MGITDSEFLQNHDVHIHVPEGATPKDGPSAGLAICTAIASILTGISVRRDVAMTGEITLRGRALIIGGLKEKMLAAHRAGIKHIIIPRENVKDLKEMPATILRDLEIHPVEHLDDVLKIALSEDIPGNKNKNDASDKKVEPAVLQDEVSAEGMPSITH